MTQQNPFSASAPAALPVFYRTYSRLTEQGRESFEQVTNRTMEGISKLGKFTEAEAELVRSQQLDLKVLPSGRWLWIGGTPWIDEPKNFSGAYNCTSTRVTDFESLALMMDLAMMGSGTGACLEQRHIKNIPAIRNRIAIQDVGDIGGSSPENRRDHTYINIRGNDCVIDVGDSRAGWVEAYEGFLDLSISKEFNHTHPVKVHIDLSKVRRAGERLKGFGGTSNPVKLPELFKKLADILNGAYARRLTSVECCLLIDEAAAVVVAGNIRRSAGMRQADSNDETFAKAKDNLWQQGEDGAWSIDTKRDALRMANHTRVFHEKPDYATVENAVRKQFFSGEGAIQYAPEAVARSNADLFKDPKLKQRFLDMYSRFGRNVAKNFLMQISQLQGLKLSNEEIEHRMDRYGLNPCGEILGADFHCNLSEVHLNRIDPRDYDAQEKAFRAAALAVAALLHQEFTTERYQQSREWDPIVGVSFTGYFDFCVHAFGTEWLEWWAEGRPQTLAGSIFRSREAEFLYRWKTIVKQTIDEYCTRHDLRIPNRYTTVQPAGTKSLLTGASSGWHPPKAARFIRRITFRKDDPVAKACLAYGYSVIPAQSDKDENGRLLDNPFDERCTEWLVEIPTEVSWAKIPGADQIDISKFNIEAQWDFYMQVQRYYTTHNTSATLEFRENEIETLSELIYKAIQADQGYISAALLARFDNLETFPRLPFEPISQEEYVELTQEVKIRRQSDDFDAELRRFDGDTLIEAGPAPCDSDYCLKSTSEVEAKPFSETSFFAPV